MENTKQIIDIIYGNTYPTGKIEIMEMANVNVKQYEVKLQNNFDKPEWFYINLCENTICTINPRTRERGEYFDIK